MLSSSGTLLHLSLIENATSIITKIVRSSDDATVVITRLSYVTLDNPPLMNSSSPLSLEI